MLKIRFGMEFEFVNFSQSGRRFDPNIYYLPKGWLHTREYYTGMQEIMSAPLNWNYQNFMKTIRRAIATMKKISSDNSAIIPLYSCPMDLNYGVIFNGVHVHLNILKDGKNLFNDIVDFSSSYQLKAIELLKEMKMWSLRKEISHHIHGAICGSDYNFKLNPKFKPLFISPRRNRKPKTVEIRVFDLDDILNPNKMFEYINRIIDMILENMDSGMVSTNYKYNIYRLKEIEYLSKKWVNGDDDISYNSYIVYLLNIHYDYSYKKSFGFVNGKLSEIKRKKSKILEFAYNNY